jgi:hypothetical protein
VRGFAEARADSGLPLREPLSLWRFKRTPDRQYATYSRLQYRFSLDSVGIFPINIGCMLNFHDIFYFLDDICRSFSFGLTFPLFDCSDCVNLHGLI